ncbi:hypothetical protein LTR49_000992 [Elasticomyces elasticus]|nr:hypothetical protein LTR49_000992 [Elasticomyces elasticus]
MAEIDIVPDSQPTSQAGNSDHSDQSAQSASKFLAGFKTIDGVVIVEVTPDQFENIQKHQPSLFRLRDRPEYDNISSASVPGNAIAIFKQSASGATAAAGVQSGSTVDLTMSDDEDDVVWTGSTIKPAGSISAGSKSAEHKSNMKRLATSELNAPTSKAAKQHQQPRELICSPRHDGSWILCDTSTGLYYYPTTSDFDGSEPAPIAYPTAAKDWYFIDSHTGMTYRRPSKRFSPEKNVQAQGRSEVRVPFRVSTEPAVPLSRTGLLEKILDMDLNQEYDLPTLQALSDDGLRAIIAIHSIDDEADPRTRTSTNGSAVARKPEPSVEVKKSELSVDVKKREPSVDVKKREPSVDVKKREPSVDIKNTDATRDHALNGPIDLTNDITVEPKRQTLGGRRTRIVSDDEEDEVSLNKPVTRAHGKTKAIPTVFDDSDDSDFEPSGTRVPTQHSSHAHADEVDDPSDQRNHNSECCGFIFNGEGPQPALSMPNPDHFRCCLCHDTSIKCFYDGITSSKNFELHMKKKHRQFYVDNTAFVRLFFRDDLFADLFGCRMSESVLRILGELWLAHGKDNRVVYQWMALHNELFTDYPIELWTDDTEANARWKVDFIFEDMNTQNAIMEQARRFLNDFMPKDRQGKQKEIKAWTFGTMPSELIADPWDKTTCFPVAFTRKAKSLNPLGSYPKHASISCAITVQVPGEGSFRVDINKALIVALATGVITKEDLYGLLTSAVECNHRCAHEDCIRPDHVFAGPKDINNLARDNCSGKVNELQYNGIDFCEDVTHHHCRLYAMEGRIALPSWLGVPNKLPPGFTVPDASRSEPIRCGQGACPFRTDEREKMRQHWYHSHGLSQKLTLGKGKLPKGMLRRS